MNRAWPDSETKDVPEGAWTSDYISEAVANYTYSVDSVDSDDSVEDGDE